jgi:gas vesicle protein
MRFVLYFFTWVFVVQTIGNLARGETDQFITGLFLSGLMVWWSVSVRRRRIRKLAGDQTSKDAKPQSNWNRSWGELKAELSDTWKKGKSEIRAESSETWNKATGEIKAEISKLASPMKSKPDSLITSSEEESSSDLPLDAVTPAVELFPETQTDKSSELNPFNHEAGPTADTEAQVEPAEQAKSPERPLWTDAYGKPLHVGAKVSFLANNRGQSVNIPGTLLGERDGKALIEVASGALLPKNDYSIPWNLVALVS